MNKWVAFNEEVLLPDEVDEEVKVGGGHLLLLPLPSHSPSISIVKLAGTSLIETTTTWTQRLSGDALSKVLSLHARALTQAAALSKTVTSGWTTVTGL